jgi:hypothetical protein
MLVEARRGEVKVKSSIEEAIIKDLKQEIATGEETKF